MNISPGVYTKIIDLSEYVQAVPGTIGFIPFISEQGPDNQLIFTNSSDFYVDFGLPNINYVGKAYGQGPYMASSFLRESESLYVVRCLPDDAAWSNLKLSSSAVDSTAYITSSSVSGLNTDAEMAANLADEGDLVIFYGQGRGEFYNNYQIKISENANPESVGMYVLDIYKRQAENDPVTGNPQYEILSTFNISFDYRQLDPSGESMFIEDVLNKYSRFVKCSANSDQCLIANDLAANFSTPLMLVL